MLDALWERIRGDSDADRSLLQDTRKRFLTFTAVHTIVVATVWVVLTGSTVIGGRPLVALLCAIAPVAFAPFPYLAVQARINLDLLCHAYLITLFVIVTLVAGALGGVVSTTSFFLMLLPLLGTLLLGVRVGIMWAVIVASTYASLHFAREVLPPSTYDILGAPPNDRVLADEVSLWNACMMTLLALAGCFSVANFRAVVGKSSAMLVDAARTARGALEAQAIAEEVNRSKSEFIANVSHELRTPLNAIIGYSEMLIESAEDRKDAESATDNAHVLDAAMKLRAMINDLLRLSAIEAGRIPVDSEDCNVDALVRDAVQAANPIAALSGSTIEVVFEAPAGTWRTDGANIDLCVRNLLSNATKFTRGDTIRVKIAHTLREQTSWLRIEVDDPGTNLSTSGLDTIFEPFAQAEVRSDARYEGVGLGLAVARRVVRILGGDLTAHRRPDHGLRFILEAPAEFTPSRRPKTYEHGAV